MLRPMNSCELLAPSGIVSATNRQQPPSKEHSMAHPISRESTLRKENHQLKRVLAEKTLEVDFFKGALQKIEARRQTSDRSGARASTTRSGE